MVCYDTTAAVGSKNGDTSTKIHVLLRLENRGEITGIPRLHSAGFSWLGVEKMQLCVAPAGMCQLRSSTAMCLCLAF